MTASDIGAVCAFAEDGMQAHLYPLRVSRPKIEHLVKHMLASRNDFHQIAVSDGAVVGAIAAVTSEIPFFERLEAHVVMCRAIVPGVGRKLIASLKAWADASPMIRRVQFPQEFHADKRALRLLARYGFDQCVTTCVYYKR